MIQGRDRMGLFLNSKIPFINYSTMVADPYFVDKSALLGELLPALCMKINALLFGNVKVLR